jgi:hypothetical protein
LNGQEFIRLFSLAQSLKEYRQIEMVVHKLWLKLPRQLLYNNTTLRVAPWKLTAMGRSPRS